MTRDEELEHLADFVLRMAQADLELSGSVTPIIAVRTKDGKIEDLKFPAKFGNVVNNPEAKEVLFGGLRKMAAALGWTAVIFGGEAWIGVQTEAGMKLPPEEFLRIMRESESGLGTAESLGLIRRMEAIHITVQTPSGAMSVTQEFFRDAGKITYGELFKQTHGVDDVAGRSKMFGNLSPENLS